MNWQVWDQIEPVLSQHDIQPILAVIPDNRDPRLVVSAPAADFWLRVRRWQKKGWAIGLHGYQHVYQNRNAGLLGLTPQSEFAGIEEGKQRRALTAAVAIFKDNGVNPDCWVAPSHSFDATTVRLLAEVNISVISDGLFSCPHTDTFGITWVPQQLWGALTNRPAGVWTACYHHNSWQDHTLKEFIDNTRQFSGRFTNLKAVVASYRGRRLTLSDRVEALWTLYRRHRIPKLKSRFLTP